MIFSKDDPDHLRESTKRDFRSFPKRRNTVPDLWGNFRYAYPEFLFSSKLFQKNHYFGVSKDNKTVPILKTFYGKLPFSDGQRRSIPTTQRNQMKFVLSLLADRAARLTNGTSAPQPANNSISLPIWRDAAIMGEISTTLSQRMFSGKRVSPTFVLTKTILSCTVSFCVPQSIAVRTLQWSEISLCVGDVLLCMFSLQFHRSHQSDP